MLSALRFNLDICVLSFASQLLEPRAVYLQQLFEALGLCPQTTISYWGFLMLLLNTGTVVNELFPAWLYFGRLFASTLFVITELKGVLKRLMSSKWSNEQRSPVCMQMLEVLCHVLGSISSLDTSKNSSPINPLCWGFKPRPGEVAGVSPSPPLGSGLGSEAGETSGATDHSDFTWSFSILGRLFDFCW